MKLNDCGCCGREDEVSGVHNDPGLSEVSVRVGDFASFKKGMHDALGRADALNRLTTRDDSDPALALVDAWSTALDVLTFYNDRIANEGYLRTAVEPRSMQEFAREIGYRPAPATAATVDLAFKVEKVDSVRIDVGTKVQSQPGQDELPQIFETLETIVGRPELNLMPVKWLQPNPLDNFESSAAFVGISLDVKVGDTLLFLSAQTATTPATDSRHVARVKSVERDDANGNTVVTWTPNLTGLGANPKVFIMRQKAAVFGYNAIELSSIPAEVRPSPNPAVWADTNLSGNVVDLDALYPTILPGSWVLLRDGATSHAYKVSSPTEVTVRKFLMSGKVTRITLDRNVGATDFNPRSTSVLAASEELILAPRPITTPYTGDDLELAEPVEIESGRTLLLMGKRPRVVIPGVTEFVTSEGDTIPWVQGTIPRLDGMPRIVSGSTAFTNVILDDGTAGTVKSYPYGFSYRPPLETDPADLWEKVIVDDDGELKSELQHPFDRATSTFYGNVARASHGETKNEVLGGGNAAKPFQKFTLSHVPLTYLPAPTETGYESTLNVRVDGVLWHETDTLLDDGPRDRAYTARQNESGKTQVTFGSGIQGARPATGVENIAAKYRVGAGLAGRVRKGQLNMLLTRPLGVTEVANPLAAEGGTDPEPPEDIAKNIPRSVLTLGRIVSLSDFADAAARLPGVAKAQASLLWKGDQRVVFVTVSGPNGSKADLQAVRASLDVQRDVRQAVEIGQAERLRFGVELEVIVREDYGSEKVLAEVQTVLSETFGFDGRDFAEATTTSEIAAAVHRVPGVRAANVTMLDFTTVAIPGDNDVLRIKPARLQGTTLLPAQILVIDPSKIVLKEVPSDV